TARSGRAGDDALRTRDRCQHRPRRPLRRRGRRDPGDPSLVVPQRGREDSQIKRPDGFRLPERPRDGHKGTFGTVVVLAGSQGYTGAAYLTSMGAARAGAGIVRLMVAQSIYAILAEKCTEVIVGP